MRCLKLCRVFSLALSLGPLLGSPPGLAGNTTGTTRTQSYQPGEPYTGLPGGAPGRGYGTGPSGAPSVYCQNWPGQSPYPQYPGTGPNTPCGPNFQTPPAQTLQPETGTTTSCQVASTGSLEAPAGGAQPFILAGWSQVATPANWREWMDNSADDVPAGFRSQIWTAQNNEITQHIYATNRPFVQSGPPLPRGMSWKKWWATNNVCVTATLRCYAVPGNPLNSTCKVIQPPQGLIPQSPDYCYWVFLRDKVLPQVLPNDSVVPPWPMGRDGRPLQGTMQINFAQNAYYFDLVYTFTLVNKPIPRRRSGH